MQGAFPIRDGQSSNRFANGVGIHEAVGESHVVARIESGEAEAASRDFNSALFGLARKLFGGNLVRKFGPEEIPSLRRPNPDFGKLPPERLQHCIAVFAHILGDFHDVIRQAISPHQVRDDPLRERAGSALRLLCRHSVDDRLRANRPAKPYPVAIYVTEPKEFQPFLFRRFDGPKSLLTAAHSHAT